MIYFTAAFGEIFVRRIATAMLRSFRRSNPSARVLYFCENPAWVPADLADVETRPLDLADLLAPYDVEFYQRQVRHRRNVFKFSLFRQLSDEFPGETLCWIDADSLILDDLGRHFRERRLNVISHGRRDHEVVDCGNGLFVPGKRFVVGGVFSIPAGDCCEEVCTLAQQRPLWRDHGYWPGSGDQISFNHLVARYLDRANFLCDDRRFIFNSSFHDGIWPLPGDPGLRAIQLRDEGYFHGSRQFVIWNWYSSILERHFADGFESFAPEVGRRLKELYA